MDTEHRRHAIDDSVLRLPGVLPDGAAGIDSGMTLTKLVVSLGDDLVMSALETDARSAASMQPVEARTLGVTGARAAGLPGVAAQEIEAAARGVAALLRADGRDPDGFILALLGTGTAFAAVRDGKAAHLGGTPLGGGSFAGIARRIEPSLSYESLIAAAERGDRRNVDAMISDIYPEGIGRVGPDLTAAHLVRPDGGTSDDYLAGLLNLHGENIAQIAASRAIIAGVRRIVLAGGFAHNNGALVTSIGAMCALFGVAVETVPSPAYAGALGAAIIAAEREGVS